MIEPLADAAPEPPEPIDLKIVLSNITFEDGKLWKPRYPSLLQYDRMRGIQLEPALLVRTKEPMVARILFDIGEGQGITFVKEEGNRGSRVKCRSLDRPLDPEVPGLVEARWESETSCTLYWNQAAANAYAQERFQDSSRSQEMTVLRLYCQGGSEPADEWEKAATAVEGGLYLVILYSPREGSRSRLIDLTPPNFPVVSREASQPEVQICDFDVHGRPVCDVFRPLLERADALDQDVELEVAFRAREGESVEMDLTLNVQDMALRWKDLGGEAEVIPFGSQERPWQLQSARLLEDGKTCRIHWLQQQACRPNGPAGESEATLGDLTVGRAHSFLLKVDTSGENVEEELSQRFGLLDRHSLDRFIARMAIDPTVIEPPTCTPEGQCLPRPPRGDL